MLSPRLAKVMLNQYRKENPVGIADSTFRGAATRALETKFGWGHEAWVRDLADTVKKMEFAPEWTPDQVTKYIAKFILLCEHSSASSVSHERGGPDQG